MKNNKMKKTILCMLAVVLVLMLGISCTASSTDPEEEEVYELRAHFWMSSTSNTADGIRLTMDLIEERSEGRIQFTDVTWSGIATMDNNVDLVENDAADLAYALCTALDANKYPYTSLLGWVPTYDHSWASLVGGMTEYQKMDFMQEEWADSNIYCTLMNIGPHQTLWSKEELPTLASCEGVNFFCLGTQCTVVEEIGGIPITMNSTEAYDGFAKGVFDAVLYAAVYVPQWRWAETLKHFYPNMGGGGVNTLMIWNRKTVDSMPEDLQEIILEVGRDHAAHMYQEIVLRTTRDVLYDQTIAEENVQIHEWSAEDVAAIGEAFKVPGEVWLAEMEDKGFSDIREKAAIWEEICRKWEAELEPGGELYQEAEDRGWLDDYDELWKS
jgi:TRAP-type C4-dicarboxylate transport system substrate-binding protein